MILPRELKVPEMMNEILFFLTFCGAQKDIFSRNCLLTQEKIIELTFKKFFVHNANVSVATIHIISTENKDV